MTELPVYDEVKAAAVKHGIVKPVRTLTTTLTLSLPLGGLLRRDVQGRGRADS
jgi:hypothetical protein